MAGKVRSRVHCPYLGGSVVLDDNGWNHILHRHPMFGRPEMEEAIYEAIRSPRFITDDAFPGQKVAYYGAIPPPFRPTSFVKVPVILTKKGGIVMTAHPATSVPPKEVVVWGVRP